jgi:O-antigen/teichoic acid export membrane protein
MREKIRYYIKIFMLLVQRKDDNKYQAGKSLQRYRGILFTGLSASIVKIFTTGISLITVPLTINYLGAERYGLWMAISSIIAFMTFADMGLGNGLLNAIAKSHGKGSIEDAQVAISSTFFMLFGISIIIISIFLTTYSLIPWDRLLNAKSELAISESGPTIFTMVIIFSINLPLGVIRRIQDGYQEGYKFQKWEILGSILSLIGLLTCIYYEAGLPLLVLAFSGGRLAALIINGMFLFTVHRKELIPRLKYFSVFKGKKLIGIGMVFFGLQLFSLIGNSSDSLVITQVMGPSFVTEFEIVKKLFTITMFTQFLIQPLWPAFSEALESKDYVWAKKTLIRALIISISAGGLIALPLLIYGKQIILMWIGPTYVPKWSLLIGFYIFVLQANYGGVMSTFLNSGELVKKQLLIIGLASMSALLLKLILIEYYSISGIIWATLIAYSIFYVIPSYKIAFNYINGKIPHVTNT